MSARYKDANECLMAGVTPAAMAAALAHPEVLRPQHLKAIEDFEDEIWQKFHPEGRDQLGLLLPWGNQHGSSLPFRFRYSEVTVWTGYNKHGKSEVLNHCIVDLCWQGERALICSLEIAAPETYRKVIRMAHGRRHVCAKEERDTFRERVLKPLADKIWVYDHVGNANVDEVLNVMLYAYQRYGCRQFVLDSLMKFEGLDGEGQEIWNCQREFMNKLLTFAATYGVHVHLVAHSKKPDRKGEAAIPRRYDIMGSSYISNLAFNVIVVWRNRDKQDELEKVWQACADAWVTARPGEAMPPWKRLMGGPPPASALQLKEVWNAMIAIVEKHIPDEQRETFLNRVQEHDAYFIVDAQRGGDGDTPARHLWFEVDSLQFLEASPWKLKNDKRGRAKAYVEQRVVEMDEEL